MTNQTHRIRRTLTALALLGLGVTATACLEDDEPFIVEPTAGALFDTYVSLGNSITAGYQSDGINVSTQEQAYPVLLAAKAGASFGVPALALPGCPPPLAGPLTMERIVANVACAYRALPLPPIVQNLAVPGAAVADLTSPGEPDNVLVSMVLGGRTQVSAMIDDKPSLVSVWIGNNDALGAALYGDTLLLNTVANFQTAYDSIVAGILATPAQDAILIGVADAAQVAPALQPGAYFYAAANSGISPIPMAVSANCAPGTAGGSRLVSILTISTQLASGADTLVVDCAEDAPFVLNQTERTIISTRIAAFNSYIAQQAEDNGWIYVDPNTSLIGPALSDPNKIRKCQGFLTLDPTLPPAEFQAAFGAAVQNTCPGPTAPNNSFFGTFFSYDGVHPSAAAHAAIADTLAGRLNAKHGLSLPVGS